MFRRFAGGVRSFWIDAFCVVGFCAMAVLVAQPRSSSRTNAAPAPQGRVVLGEPVKMGLGAARSWVRLDAQSHPVSIGIRLDEAALNGLPDKDTKRCCDGPEFVLALPKDVSVAPFDHIGINWNPRGHIPVGIYDKPHFDFHFYMMDQSTREKITGSKADHARECKVPTAECIPVDYVSVDESMPRMGNHLADLTSPEFQGVPFTKTFIYGSLDGKITFVEPMVTRAYLLTHPDAQQPIKQPRKYPGSGYFPTHYGVKYDSATGDYLISLDGLTPR